MSTCVLVVCLLVAGTLPAQEMDWRAVAKQAQEFERLGSAAAVKTLVTEALRPSGPPLEVQGTGTLLWRLARSQQYLGEHEEADRRYRAAISALERAGDAAQITLARALADHASLVELTGSTTEVQRKRLRALQILGQWLGPHHHLVLALRGEMAAGHYARRDYERAESQCRQVIEAWGAAGIPADARLAMVWSTLAYVQLQTGRASEAAGTFGQSLSITEAQLGPSHPNLLDAWLGLALAHAALKDFNRADALLAQATAVAAEAFEPGHPAALLLLDVRARLLRANGRGRQAKAIEKSARAIRRTPAAPRHTVSWGELVDRKE